MCRHIYHHLEPITDEWTKVIEGIQSLRQRSVAADQERKALIEKESSLNEVCQKHLIQIQSITAKHTNTERELNEAKDYCVILAQQCHLAEEKVRCAETEYQKLKVALQEAEKERDNLTLQLANEAREVENLIVEKERADLEKESAQDELVELKEQLELKDRSI